MADDMSNLVVAPGHQAVVLPWTLALCLLSALILVVGVAVPGWLFRHPLTVFGWSGLFTGIAAVRLVRMHGHAQRRNLPPPPAIALGFIAVGGLLAAHVAVAGAYLWMVSRIVR